MTKKQLWESKLAKRTQKGSKFIIYSKKTHEPLQIYDTYDEAAKELDLMGSKAPGCTIKEVPEDQVDYIVNDITVNKDLDLNEMKGDKKIIGLVKKLDSKIKEWLNLTTKDAWSDRLLEEIISLSKLIEETHESRFNENATDSLNAKDKFIKHWAIEDKKYGQPLSADDFNMFVKIGKEDGFKLNEHDFEKYFEFFHEYKITEDDEDELIESKLAQRGKQLKEAYDDFADAIMRDDTKVSASASTRSTRTYNYEDVEFEFGARKGFGTYRWMNRPWQRFDFAEALKNAMIDAGVDKEFARECIDKSGSLRSAVEYFAKNYKVDKKEVEESYSKQELLDAVMNAFGYTKSEALEYIKKASEGTKRELVKGFKQDAKKNFYGEEVVKEEVEENKTYQIKYWLTEEDREEGFSDIFIDSFNSKQEAIMTAKKMVDRGDVASVEVFDADDVTEQPIYFYDGDETDLDESAQKDRKELNYLLRKEKVTSLDKYERHRLQELIQMYGRLDEQSHEDINEEKELKEARGAGKGQKLDKYYRMVVNLYKDNLSKEEIERLKKARAEVEKFEPKSEYEKRDKKNLLDQIARTLEDGTLKEALVEYDPAKWEPEDIELHKSINWKERNYEDFPVEGDTIETEVILYSLHKSPRARMVTAQKYLRANPIYPPYYEAKEVPFKDEDEGGVVGGMFDGNKHNKTMIMDRYETANLNYYLSI